MSMSNRARRMMQHQLRNKADAELNLIPMIDIMSVMVSFLLVYSTEVEVIQNSKGIEIPQSIAQQAPKDSVVVMITKGDVFVQGEHVTTVAEVQSSKDPLVGPLRDALKRMGRADLIGSGPHQLVPAHQPPGTGKAATGRAAGARRQARRAADRYRRAAAKQGRTDERA